MLLKFVRILIFHTHVNITMKRNRENLTAYIIPKVYVRPSYQRDGQSIYNLFIISKTFFLPPFKTNIAGVHFTLMRDGQ